MIINRSLTFPFVDMTWLDSDGKYNIVCWVSILEIFTMFRMKPSYLKHDIHQNIYKYNLLLLLHIYIKLLVDLIQYINNLYLLK